MVNYKRFLYTNEKIPRTTLYRRKLKEKMRLQRLMQNLPNSSQIAPVSGGAGTERDITSDYVSVDQENEACKGRHDANNMRGVNLTCHGPISSMDNISTVQTEKTSEALAVDNSQQQDSINVEASKFLSAETGTIETKSLDEAGLNSDVFSSEVSAMSSYFLEENSMDCIHQHPSQLLNSISLQHKDILEDDDSCRKPQLISVENQMKATICPCTECTSDDVMLMCLSLGFRHNLTWEAQVDILKMINAIYGKQVVPFSKKSYLKLFQNEDLLLTYHIYCSNCDLYIGKRQDLKGEEYCSECNEVFSASNPNNFFVSVSIESQLKHLVEDPIAVESLLTYRFNRKKIKLDALEDIYDGRVYKNLCAKDQVLSSPYNFSYCFFVDGVAMGSSGKSIWPIYLTLNEFPLKDRSKHLLLAGLYVGPKDPNQNLFLKPFVEEANNLSENGFSWVYKGKEIISKVIPLCLVADSVARYQLLNRQIFHAEYGCTYCYQKGQRTRRKRKFVIPEKKAADRTLESTKSDVMKAIERQGERDEKNRHYKGVKGPSVLMALKYFSIIHGLTVDYLHCILLGVIKTHMELIFECSRQKKVWKNLSDEQYAIDDLFRAIDERLLKIQPPSSITRIPRSITDRKRWKANEWRSWLLFYALPCLEGLLKDNHMELIAMLSKATYLLLQRSVNVEDINEAHRLFCSYTYFYQKYFGEENMFYNIHILSHICTGTLLYGPLWTHNAFMYESQNRHLLQMCKSPTKVAMQIARKFVVYKSIPVFTATFPLSSRSIEFCEDVLDRPLRRYISSNGILLLGKSEIHILSDDEKNSLELACGETGPANVLIFQRMLLNGIRVSCFSYSEGKQKNDSFICLEGENIAIVELILLTKGGSVILAVRKIHFHDRPHLLTDKVKIAHIREFKRYGKKKFVKPSVVQCHAIKINVNDKMYMCGIPFGCFRD